MQPAINDIAEQLKKSPKKKLVCLSTTANVNNPDFYVGSFRETSTTLAANFIFASLDQLATTIETFDPFIDAFLIDCEYKNEINDLLKAAQKLIKYSPVLSYKPNDITVDALDMWVSLSLPEIEDQKVSIIGAGNIGAKIALKLAERGAHVALFGRDFPKTEKIAESLGLILRGNGSIKSALTQEEAAQNSLLLLGCTPGIAYISPESVENLHPKATLIDVGNGTLTTEAIKKANDKNLTLLCLSPNAGYAGFIEHWEQAQLMLNKLGRKTLENGVSLISPGLIGQKGDVLVDDLHSPSRIIGVCDGKGDILNEREARPYREKVKEYDLK
ncbi:hypothetical protein MTBPR1_20141 [Candidatus Terasakiella magnetica]|uniref:Pyrroline-5-carboxylate reductase catalytic N-terminal domain-containing protein n=1 Tax=Candidatus Terasakiella magnetica TaxID=1867952 RepID=A0A1C3RG63_9PROT|nr:NAD(P)-binding domain-containing protein [Candidatus Terasakiella magnetica]SCA56293.1 hypothetical protein MTBPR1_20141 [Candidatus Terasakiella magnetica]